MNTQCLNPLLLKLQLQLQLLLLLLLLLKLVKQEELFLLSFPTLRLLIQLQLQLLLLLLLLLKLISTVQGYKFHNMMAVRVKLMCAL